jgi:diguanylate cyclase (GGDEF)-like protein
LTGIPTRRAFYVQFDRELSRALRYRVPLSCVMIDVDYFKKINDTQGHPAGDAVLKAVAQYVQQSCRASDYVGRYGGEEFCVLLTETTEQAAMVWAERVRNGIANLQILVGQSAISVTASLGVAQLMEDQRASAQLVDLADQALLVAKQAGRNRVVRFRALADERHLKLGAQAGSGDPFATLKARNVMTTLVACLQQDETIGKAAEFFLRFRINSSPVVDDAGKLVGILSEKDVIAVMMQPECWNKPISDAMKTNVVCYEEETPVKAIYDFLCRVTIRRVIIVKDGFPTGMISRGTLLRWYNNWLAVNCQLPQPVARDGLASERQRRHQALADTGQSLATAASYLQRQLANEAEDFLPALIDTASRMQEMVNDLLSDSRYFLDAPPTDEFALTEK